MIKKFFIITLFLVMILFIVPQIFACSITPFPYFSIRTSELNKCYFTSDNENLSSNVDIIEFINNKPESEYANCDNLVLSEDEQQIFRNVINQFNKEHYGFSAIYIEKQSSSEYINFQNRVEEINADKCDCERYDNVTRYADWTVYLKLSDCEHNTSCQAVPPNGCVVKLTYKEKSLFVSIMERYNFEQLILLFVGSITVIIGLVFLIRFLIKKSRKT